MFYVVTVNGDVATVANLEPEDGERLRQWAAQQGGLDRINVVEQPTVATDLFTAQAEVEVELDSWR